MGDFTACTCQGILFSSQSYSTGSLATSQATDFGRMAHVHISTSGAPVWIAVGPPGTTATQGSNNEMLLPADRMIGLTLPWGSSTVALIEEFPNPTNAHAAASVAEIG